MSQRRVLVLNNYPLDRVLNEVQLGETPDHVLFGVNNLERCGLMPILLPFPAAGFFSRISKVIRLLRIPLELGDLQQQVIALRLSKTADLVYAPCASQTHLLQYLRSLGLYRLPIVTLVHHPIRRGRLDFLRSWQRRLFIHGADRLPTLSAEVLQILRVNGASSSQLSHLAWGPDLNFYGPWQPPGSGVFSSGRTGRDLQTLVSAAALAQCNVTLVYLKGHLDTPFLESTSKLRIIEASDQQPQPGKKIGWMKYPELCDHMRSHAAIAIPLYSQNSLAGLTSLMDALALGRAVLMTRNPYVSIDIESEGIGFWIDPGDVSGWVNRLNWINDHPKEVVSMGQRARILAESKYNSDIFSRQLNSLLLSVATSS